MATIAPSPRPPQAPFGETDTDLAFGLDLAEERDVGAEAGPNEPETSPSAGIEAPRAAAVEPDGAPTAASVNALGAEKNFASALKTISSALHSQEDHAIRLGRPPAISGYTAKDTFAAGDGLGVIGATGFGLLGPAGAETLGMALDRSSVAATIEVPSHVGLADVTLLNSAGFLSANASLTSATGTTIGGFVGASSSSGLPGAGLNFSQTIGHAVGFGAGAVGLIDADFHTKIAKMTDDGQVEVLSHGHQFVASQLSANVGSHGVSLGIRRYDEIGVARELRQQVGQAEAKALKSGKNFFARKFNGIFGKKQAALAGVFEDARQLAAGDEASERRTSSTALSAVLGLFGVAVGGHRINATTSAAILKHNATDEGRMDVAIEISSASSKVLSLDLPLLGTASRSRKELMAEKLGMTLDIDQATSAGILEKTSRWGGLNKHYQLPASLDLKAIREAENPLAALMLFRQLSLQDTALTHYSYRREYGTNGYRLVGLPLFKTLLGTSRAGLSFEKEKDKNSYQLIINQEQSMLVRGEHKEVHSERLGRGAASEKLSYFRLFNIKMSAPALPSPIDNEFFLDRTNVLVVNRSIELAGPNELNTVLSWVNLFQPRASEAGIAPPSSDILPAFRLDVSLLLTITEEDKERLYAYNLFGSLELEAAGPEATRRGALSGGVDRELNNLLKTNAPAATIQKVLKILEKPMEIVVDTDLPQKLEKQTAKIVTKHGALPSSVLIDSPIEVIAQHKERVDDGHKIAQMATEADRLLQHPLFHRADHTTSGSELSHTTVRMKRNAAAVAGLPVEKLPAVTRELANRHAFASRFNLRRPNNLRRNTSPLGKRQSQNPSSPRLQVATLPVVGNKETP